VRRLTAIFVIRRKMRRDWRGSRCPTWCRAG